MLPDKVDTSIEVSGRKCGMGRDETSECLLAEKRFAWSQAMSNTARNQQGQATIRRAERRENGSTTVLEFVHSDARQS
jgi:hypothetical protein